MSTLSDKNTRYYVDIEVETKKVPDWDFGNRFELSKEYLPQNIIRISISKGQFNKLPKEKEQNDQGTENKRKW